MEATSGGKSRIPKSRGCAIAETIEGIESNPLTVDVTAAHDRQTARQGESERRVLGRGNAMELGWPRVSVVIPTLNEAQNLPHVLGKLPHGLHEVIIVDGLSEDGTVEVARFLRPDAKIELQTGRGKGEALRCGFEASSGDVIVMLDADGSADPSEIPRFVQALVNGADFAKGSRLREGGGSADLTRLRRAGNWGLTGTVNLLFGTAYTDLCYGYNAFWRRCLGVMCVDCTGFEVETLINIRIARAGLDTTEVPSFEGKRIHGQSNLRTFRDGWRVLRTIVRERLRPMPAAAHEQYALSKELEPIPVEAG